MCIGSPFITQHFQKSKTTMRHLIVFYVWLCLALASAEDSSAENISITTNPEELEKVCSCKTGIINTTWTGPWNHDIRANVRYSKSCDSVTLQLPEVRASAIISNNVIMIIPLPQFLRPDRFISFTLRVRDAAVDIFGEGLLGPDGSFFVGIGADITAFSGLYNTGFYATDIQYLAA